MNKLFSAAHALLPEVLASGKQPRLAGPNHHYPGVTWDRHSLNGWHEPVLKKVREYAATKKTAAVVIIQSGKVVDQWGEVGKKIEVRSIRKSMLSALYGIHVAEGHIDLGKTLAELGIDDSPPALTEIEKQATILDLLRARSGVYHDAARETPRMRALRPARGSHPPGAFYYYNNWDFNVLGSIFEQQTGKKIFEEFAVRIARPIGMEDFVASDGRFAGADGSTIGGSSVYLNYIFSMTARDLARFGFLYLRHGRWGQKQILPASWVTRSTTSYSEIDGAQPMPATGYGFLWHTMDWGYAALGAGGHVIAVIPARDLVIVHRVAYDPPREDFVSHPDVSTMIRMVIDAAPIPKSLE
jgi:CubicO group peptidase (beta-lactamase class C family)